MKILSIGNRSITSTIFSTHFLIVIFLLPYFKNDFFLVIPGLSLICNVLIAFEFLFMFSICLIEIKTSNIFKVILALEIWIYVIAPLISKSTAPSYYYLFQCIGIMAFFELGFKRNYYLMLDVITKMFTLFIVLNAMMLVFKIDNYTDVAGVTIYLLGMRTLFSIYIVPGMLFTLLRDKEIRRISIRTVMIFIAGIYSLINQAVSTGLIEVSIIVCLLLMLKSKRITRRINFTYVAVLLFVFNFSLTVFGEQFGFLRVITDFFGKDMTFSGRTPIWLKVVDKLKYSPIAGYGRDSSVLIVETQRNAHNQWLFTAMEGGYVAMVILIFATIMSVTKLSRRKNENWYNSVAICTIAILVGTITEIQTYIPFFYIVLLLPFIIPEEKDKNWYERTKKCRGK